MPVSGLHFPTSSIILMFWSIRLQLSVPRNSWSEATFCEHAKAFHPIYTTESGTVARTARTSSRVCLRRHVRDIATFRELVLRSSTDIFSQFAYVFVRSHRHSTVFRAGRRKGESIMPVTETEKKKGCGTCRGKSSIQNFPLGS